MISKRKKVLRSIHGGSLSLCKCRRARIKGPVGRSLPMSALTSRTDNGVFRHCARRPISFCENHLEIVFSTAIIAHPSFSDLVDEIVNLIIFGRGLLH